MTTTASRATKGVHMAQRADAATPLPPPTLLQADKELADLRISATQPLLFFAIALPAPRLVSVRLQESNTAGRCQLLLSPVHEHPSVHNAVWRLLSPGPLKTLAVHPADANYRTGQLYLAVQYLEDSGGCLLRLRVTLQEHFAAPWFQRVRCVVPTVPSYGTWQDTSATPATSGIVAPAVPSEQRGDEHGGGADDVELGNTLSTRNTASEAAGEDEECPATEAGPLRARHGGPAASARVDAVTCCSFYIGDWRGASRHGRGMAFYSSLDDPSGAVATATHSATRAGNDAAAATIVADQSAMLVRTVYERCTLPWSANSLPEFMRMCAAAGDAGEDSELTTTWMSRVRPVPDLHAASGWCVIDGLPAGVEAYDGAWEENVKHGFGVYQWADRSYVGMWRHNAREGSGALTRQDGSWYRGEWQCDRRHGYGEARLVPSQAIYRGQWVRGRREGDGVLEYANGIVVRGTWRADVLQRHVRASYPDGSEYEGEWQNDGRHGAGTLTDPQRCIYTNTWHHDQRQGEGEVVLTNEVRFRGVWSADAITSGCYHFPNGDVYTGEWDGEHNLREGRGRCVARNGDVYDGEWHADRRHGHGVMSAADGRWRYEGEWRDGQRCGHGVLADAEGVYEGEFDGNVRSGEGVQRGADGSHYHGSWRNDHRAGRGVYYNAKEDILYEGIFLHDRLQGLGKAVVHTPTDEQYDGTWLDGLRQGGGTLELANGDVMRGIWHRGVHQNGRVEYHYAHGDKYVGEWRDGQRHGHGTLLREDGSVYDGAWAHDTPHGHGCLTKPSGETVEGEWRAGALLDGPGVLEMIDGSVYRGELRGGVPHGEGELSYPDGTTFRGHFEDGIYIL